jgi:hypothetical protein
MANDYLYSAIVNQKLAFARLELAAAAGQHGDTINAKLARHAHLDSAAAQLCGALSYFVAEVAEQYDLTLEPSLNSVAAMLAAFASSGKQSAEINELLVLQKRAESWLGELMRASANPLFLAERFKNQNDEAPAAGEGLIPLTDVTRKTADQDPLELTKGWERSAQAIIDRLRESLHEE